MPPPTFFNIFFSQTPSKKASASRRSCCREAKTSQVARVFQMRTLLNWAFTKECRLKKQHVRGFGSGNVGSFACASPSSTVMYTPASIATLQRLRFRR